MIRAGIVGATGYAGVELLRLLIMHPEVEVTGVTSTTFKGKNIEEVYPNLSGFINKECKDLNDIIDNCDVVFTGLPHGLSEEIAVECDKRGVVLIDLGADFRLDSEEDYEKWYGLEYKNKELHEKSQYGLCELYREDIKKAKIIGNPGCYPTSVILGLAPLLDKGYIKEKSIIVSSDSGVTGSGRGLSQGTHYPECNENLKAYKIDEHRHIPEIEQELSKIADNEVTITFIPHLVPVNRGILSTIVADLKEGLEGVTTKELTKIYNEFYKNEKFVRVIQNGTSPESKNIVRSNFCDVSVNVTERTNRVIVVSAIDNMVKGAAGQAVQNMNIVFGLKEDTGINYVPAAF